ncbi:hypothetical protein [Paenibacillus hubeiensis]|uniref:hypothetical protein n=1 Tax=Paenibacillus hubeiensis TaxID=3077330 RepID=UPI0031BB5440
MELKRIRIVDGIEVASREYFNALQAVNFIDQHNMEWFIKPGEDRDYDLEQMIEHAKIIAADKGMELTVNTCHITGYLKLGLAM